MWRSDPGSPARQGQPCRRPCQYSRPPAGNGSRNMVHAMTARRTEHFPDRLSPALGALRLSRRRRRGRPPRRARRDRRALPWHPAPGVKPFVAYFGDPAGAAYRRGRWWPQAVRDRSRPWCGDWHGGHHAARRRGRGLAVRIGLRCRGRRWLDPDYRGHRHREQQDHECQGGLEHVIQHDQTHVSHSSLLSRPVTSSCPACPALGRPDIAMELSYQFAAKHATGRDNQGS